MKKLIFVLLILLTCGCASHTNNQLEDLIGVISEKQNVVVFNDLTKCINLDDETEFILESKVCIDKAQLQLIKLVEYYYSSDDLSNTLNFTKYILRFYSFNESMTEVTDCFQRTVQYLKDFIVQDKVNDTEYQSLKRLVTNNDDHILDVQTSLLNDLTSYSVSQQAITSVFNDVLTFVTNKDIEGAAERMSQEDVQKFYLDAAVILNSYYDYLISRAESIKSSYELYKSKNGN